MNAQKSWDPTLVKKFSFSNHFKLLNQLRSEVKKYPLNIFWKSSMLINDLAVNFTSDKKTIKKNIAIAA